MDKLTPTAIALFLAGASATPAQAKIPPLNHTCPVGIGMFTDANGRVYVNSQEAEVREVGKGRYTATVPGIVISITVDADGSPRVSYTARGASGACPEVPPPSEDNG